MKKGLVVTVMLTCLLLAGFASGVSYAEKAGSAAKVEKAKQEETAPPMGRFRQRGMGMGMMGEEHQVWKALRDLGLGEKQMETIKDIRNKAKKEAIRKGADLRIAGLELRELLDKEPVDVTAVEAKLKQMEPLRTEMRLLLIKSLEEIKAVLTPEQKQKFKANLKKHLRWQNRWLYEDEETVPEGRKKHRK